MKPSPHPHSCPACQITWECRNEHCEDPESHWCRNFADTCPRPPRQVVQIRALLDAMEELHHAAYTIEARGGDAELAEDVRMIRKRVQWKAGWLADHPIREG